MRTGKSTGIHFLNDENTARRIVNLANILGKTVLEVGPGMGALTQHIKGYRSLYLIEKEKSFESYLRSSFPEATIIMDDALEVDWPTFDIFISNMPYKITSPLLEKLWSYSFDEAVITIQKEVADRLIARPGSKDYSKLSVMMQMKFNIKKEFDISPSRFNPPPKVHSTVLKLTRNDAVIDDEFKDFLKILFSQRRKKIKNVINIKKYGENRPEELTIEEILEVYNDFNDLQLS